MNKQSIKLYVEFEKEAIPHMDDLYNFAFWMTGKRRAANKLIQKTYLKAFRFYAKLENGTDYRGWLFRILKNSYLNMYSKTPDQVGSNQTENLSENMKSFLSYNPSPENHIFFQLPDNELSEAIAALPEELKTVIVLCDIENFSYDQIADFVDCPIGTVRSRLSRARKLLFKKLFECANEKGYISK